MFWVGLTLPYVMDWSKYPLEKLVYFVAGIIPGCVVLLVFGMAHPGSFDWFFRIRFLGYRSQLTLLVLTCFVLGYSITTFLRGFLGGLGGIYGATAKRFYKLKAPSYLAAPWQDPRWRTLLIRHLGTSSLHDTRPIAPDILETRRQMIDLMPQNERPRALYELNSEKLAADLEDIRWERWYAHYHEIVLQPDPRDLFFHVGWGLRINFQAAAIYILGSAFVVPQLRHWWCLGPALIWVLLLVAEEFTELNKLRNQWSTLDAQIKYLSETQSEKQGSRF
jgi:hypothetical protein